MSEKVRALRDKPLREGLPRAVVLTCAQAVRFLGTLDQLGGGQGHGSREHAPDVAAQLYGAKVR